MKRNELEPLDRVHGAASGPGQRLARRSPRLTEATVVLAVCLGSAIVLVGIGLFFRLVTGLSVLP